MAPELFGREYAFHLIICSMVEGDMDAGSNMKTALEYKDKNNAEANHNRSVPMSICGQFFLWPNSWTKSRQKSEESFWWLFTVTSTL